MGVWWDGDLLRELLDGTRIDKWDYQRGTTERLVSADQFECASNNSTKANPCLCADILGDWREEVIWRTRDNRELRVFSTTVPTEYRLPTLMHDPIYRLSVAWQNVGYNQPAHPSFSMEKAAAQTASNTVTNRSKVAPKPLYRDRLRAFSLVARSPSQVHPCVQALTPERRVAKDKGRPLGACERSELRRQ